MSIPSTGISSNIGGPQQPLPMEIEASAWAQTNRAALGIVPDSLQVPFSQLGGNVWKYSSDSSRPSLKPSGTLRTSAGEDAPVDDSWKSHFSALVDKLPLQVKAGLLNDMSKPFEMRDPDYHIFENVLTLTARGLAGLDEMQKPMAKESAKMDRTKQNLGVHGRALHGTLSQSSNVLGGMQNFLNKVGPNFAAHDMLRGFAEQGADLQEELNGLLTSLQDGETPSQEIVNNLANRAATLSNDFAKLDRGKEGQIMSPMLQTMAAVAQALSLTPTAPSLFFGLKMASTGLFKNDSASGLLGSDLQTILKALTGGLMATLMQNAGSAKQLMMLMMFLATMAGAGTLGALLEEFGIGNFPCHKKGEQRAGRKYTFQLVTQMLASSGLLQTIGKIIGDACAANEKSQAVLGHATELLGLLSMTMTGAENDEEVVSTMEGLKETFREDILKIEAFVRSSIASGSVDSAMGKGLDIALIQAKTAIEKEDYEGFFAACSYGLSLVGSSQDQIGKELEEIHDLAKLFKQGCVSETQDPNKSLTGIIMAA